MSSYRRRQYSKDGRPDSLWGELGREGSPLPHPKAHAGQSIGVFTSGGDSQGEYFQHLFDMLLYIISEYEIRNPCYYNTASHFIRKKSLF